MHSNYSLGISFYSHSVVGGTDRGRQVGSRGSQPPTMMREPEGVRISFGRSDSIDERSEAWRRRVLGWFY